MPAEPMISTEHTLANEPERSRRTTVSAGWTHVRPVSSESGTRANSAGRPELHHSSRELASVASGILLCLGLVVSGPYLPKHSEPLRLAIAAFIGLLVTAVHRRPSQEADTQPMQHAQILLCVSGAMMMVIINDSLARAFGIAGAASIIRFRTPVDDPRDAAVLFLLIALGMACGLGAFALAGSGAAMLCLFLLLLSRLTIPKTRSMLVELISASSASIRSIYFARATLVELARQYWRYGFWKWRMLRRNPQTLRWRQALPPLFVLSLLGLTILSLFVPSAWWLLMGELFLYFFTLILAGLFSAFRRKKFDLLPGLVLVIPVMHIAWGLGLLWSMLSSGKQKNG